MRYSAFLAVIVLISAGISSGDEKSSDGPAQGPLRSHPTNPRYFADGSGKAIRLAGHQIFGDLQDNSFDAEFTYDKKKVLDWTWYLDFAAKRQLNFLRNWTIWSTCNGAPDPRRTTSPMMYQRVGPGNASDGLPRFDLHRFDQTFFDRMRERVQQAGQRGIYVSIMLFEPYGFGPVAPGDAKNFWNGNVFNGNNNVNGMHVNADGNEWGLEFFYTKDPAIRALQLAYVDKVIDTVNDLDNVLYEVANELYATEWQYDIIRHIHDYEAKKPKQHLVYMSPGGRTASGGWTDHTAADMLKGPADCVGIKLAPREVFLNDPPVGDPTKPVVWDNDHGLSTVIPCPHGLPWKAFTRGYHFILYDKPFESPADESEEWERTRFNIGATVTYAKRFRDLSRMNPHNKLSSTGYCLADPGREFLVYQPGSAAFTVNLPAGAYAYEWFNPASGATTDSGSVKVSGDNQSFTPPFSNDAVLYLHRN